MEKTVIELFKLWHDEPKLNVAARVNTGRLIKNYGYEAVYEAFLEAATKEHYTIAYVRGILQKRHQDKIVKEEIRQAKIKAAETKELANGKAWAGLSNFLRIEQKPLTEEYKQSESYKRAEEELKRELQKEKK